MIERINQYAARHFGGVGTTRGSLLRIHAWALAFLLIVSALAPTHDLNRNVRRFFGPVQKLQRNFSDQRAFAPSPFGRRVFHIAWIFGSEGELQVKSGFPPTLGPSLLKSLPEIGKKKVVVDAYDLSGMKLGDLYMTLLDALAAKPDLVMLSLNPVWVMNPVAVHRWPQLDARAALELAKRPAQWPLGAALLSPSDLLWGVVESKLTPLRERFYWSGRVHTLVDDLGPLDRSHLILGTLARRPDRTQVLLAQQALTFWAAYRLHLFPRGDFGTPKQIPQGPEQWARWVDVSNNGDNQMNAVLLRAIGAELRDAGIPSVVYLAQANGAWLASSKSFARAVAGVERQLAGFRGAFRARNVLYQPQNLSHFISGLVYQDEAHITNAGTAGPYFASQVCRVLAQVGRGAGCRPVVEGSNGE
jgi:hypothetical protein